mmetsp:Transcript_87025/g.173814  ORF Transcript_87025/g.173814 Transcript_87025/m.173814 type:complete len:184 (-) Transcript_87025:170-721(-)
MCAGIVVEYLVNFAYIVFAISSFLLSLWVIFLSNTLIGKSMLVALHGSGLPDIKLLEPLLRSKMQVIESGFHVSLAFLVGAVVMMISEVNLLVAILLALPCVVVVALLAHTEHTQIKNEFNHVVHLHDSDGPGALFDAARRIAKRAWSRVTFLSTVDTKEATGGAVNTSGRTPGLAGQSCELT